MNKTMTKPVKELVTLRAGFCFGLAGVSMASIAVLFTLSSLTTPQLVALCLFSLAVPILTSAGMLYALESTSLVCDPDYWLPIRLGRILAAILAFAGLEILVWNIHWLPGVLFVVSSGLAVALWVTVRARAQDLNFMSVMGDILGSI